MAAVQPPANIEAEQAVLGAILLNSRTLDRVIEAICPEDFYRVTHQEIFRAILDLWERGQAVDLVTVTALLKERGKLDAVGGPVFLSGLSDQVGTAVNAPYYARIVYEKAVVRRLLEASQEIAQTCLAPVESLVELKDAVEARIYQVLETRDGGGRAGKLAELVPAQVEALEQAFYEKNTGLNTGFYDLDRLVNLRPGHFAILAARPSKGKTALAANIAYNVAKRGVKVGFFSLEMPVSDLTLRFFASIGGINGHRLMRASLEQEEWKRLAEAAAEMLKLPIHLDDTSLTALDLRARARRLKYRGELDLLIVDYLQLLKPHKGRSREQEVTAISQALKAMAMELEVPLIALCQLNREVEKRTSKKHILADLRESGSLEQDADIVLFISRESNLAEIQVEKQRNGPTGSFRLLYDEQFMRFENLAE
jgi:replicative DNA helicase